MHAVLALKPIFLRQHAFVAEHLLGLPGMRQDTCGWAKVKWAAAQLTRQPQELSLLLLASVCQVMSGAVPLAKQACEARTSQNMT